jgi:hypothetical protein
MLFLVLVLVLVQPSTALRCDSQNVKMDNLVCDVGSQGLDNQCAGYSQTAVVSKTKSCGFFFSEDCYKCCVEETAKQICGKYDNGVDYCIFGNIARIDTVNRVTCPDRPEEPKEPIEDPKDKSPGSGGKGVLIGVTVAGSITVVSGVIYAGYSMWTNRGPVKGELTYQDKAKSRGKWEVGKEDLL